MLGPTESGKTTALQECGVEFPYVASEARKSKKGAATIGCNYWFSRNAVVLDLEGRIATEEEEFEVFSGFLDQLKRARKDRPLDGVVLTISIKEILDQPADQVELLAGSIRKRFDEMIRRLGIRFPVYILFTKCDQIEGFPEFFASFRSRNRAQIWGATISRDQTKHQPADQIFQSEFDRLAAALSAYRLRGMASEKNPDKLSRIYSFPSRFASLRKRLEDFVGTLLHPTPYSERPMFRGFYFASAAGAAAYGEPLQQPEAEWDPNRRLADPQEQPASARSYFLETLFPRVIFADRPLAKASV
jgi:type VI secretion system protein ImpL